ncbi:MAG TPA: VOC family protein [Candidatus Acidoferrales bacterium]|nr:VOC family protein [Candidatus Acidoferrales bacterium]
MGNDIVHFEIPARNPAKLSKFYTGVFQWKFSDSGMHDMKYWLIKTSANSKAVMGGMYKKGSKREMAMNYINTSNIDATLKKFKQQGGKVLTEKMMIPNIGWTAMGLDPEGNPVGIWQASGMKKGKK